MKTHAEIEAALSSVQGDICELKCARPNKAGEACTRQYENKPDREGRPLFYFGADCKIPAKQFCDSCLAYWLVAVARNLILHDAKWAALAARENG